MTATPAPGPRPELAAILDEAERAAMETDEATSRESLVSDLLAYIDRRETEHAAALAALQVQVAEAYRREKAPWLTDHYDDDPTENLPLSVAMLRVMQAREQDGRDIWIHVTNSHWTRLLLLRWHHNGRFWDWEEEGYGDGFGHCAIITPLDAVGAKCNLIAPGEGEELLRQQYPLNAKAPARCEACQGNRTVEIPTVGPEGKTTTKYVPCPSCAATPGPSHE